MKTLNYLSAAVLAAAVFPMTASADVMGGRFGANSWLQNYSGNVESGGASIDVEDDLGYDDETGYNIYFALEHPIPVLPNILLQYSKIDADASGFLDDVEFDGITYSGAVDSSIDITHGDVTLYYEILDNWANLDLGLTGRVFTNGIEITDVSTGIKGSLDIDYVIPLLYAEARFDLPLTGLSLGVTGSGIAYDGDTLYDAKATVAYEFAFGLGLEAGYRAFDLDYDDDDDRADVTIEGAFAGLYWDF